MVETQPLPNFLAVTFAPFAGASKWKTYCGWANGPEHGANDLVAGLTAIRRVVNSTMMPI